jgi:hypothetical protein
MKLQIIKKGIAQGWFEFPTESFIRIGSSPTSTLVLDDLSQTHAAIERSEGEYWIVNLGQLTTTLVNGERVLHKRLQHGDEVAMGDYCLRVSLEDAVESGMSDTRHRHHNTFVALCQELAQDEDWSAVIRRRKQLWQAGSDAIKRDVLRTCVADLREIRLGTKALRDTSKAVLGSVSRMTDDAYLETVFNLPKEEALEKCVNLLIEAEQLHGALNGKVVTAIEKDMEASKGGYPEYSQGFLLLQPLLIQQYTDKVLELGLHISRAGGLTLAKYHEQLESKMNDGKAQVLTKLKEMGLIKEGEEVDHEKLQAILKHLSEQA